MDNQQKVWSIERRCDNVKAPLVKRIDTTLKNKLEIRRDSMKFSKLVVLALVVGIAAVGLAAPAMALEIEPPVAIDVELVGFNGITAYWENFESGVYIGFPYRQQFEIGGKFPVRFDGFEAKVIGGINSDYGLVVGAQASYGQAIAAVRYPLNTRQIQVSFGACIPL